MLGQIKKISSNRLCTALFVLFAPLAVSAQEVKINSGFLADSIMIGDEAPFYLAACYPASLTVLFPDSSFKYHPFEYVRRVYFPTSTHNGNSYDSAVYYVTTFEIDSIQLLSLPVFVVNLSDCTIVASTSDTLRLDPVITHYVDSLDARDLPLKTSTAYEPVGKTFNFPLALIISFTLAILAVSTWLLFGDKITRKWRIKRLQKKYNKFLADYLLSLEKLKSDFSPSSAEAVVVVWKKYLEDLERVPFTKLTTRETLGVLREPELEQPLRTIDRSIYGNNIPSVEPFDQLRSFANKKFYKKIEELKNG